MQIVDPVMQYEYEDVHDFGPDDEGAWFEGEGLYRYSDKIWSTGEPREYDAPWEDKIVKEISVKEYVKKYIEPNVT